MRRSAWFESFCSSLERILRSNSFDYDRRRFRAVNYGAETFESRVLLSAVKPYLQNPAPDAMTVIWFTETNTAGTLTVNLPGGGNLQFNSTPEFKTELAYAAGEAATGRSNAPWMHRIRVTGLQEGTSYDYSVTQGLETYTGQLKTIPGKSSDVRFVVFGDSETEPESTGAKVQWTQPGSPSAVRPYLVDQTVGYSENLKVIESRNPAFIGIAGDIVESGGEQRDWDEFWRHNAGDINDVASSVPIFASPGNHENYGGPGGFGGYGDAGSIRAKGKFQTYWEAPANGTGGYDDRYFRIDYGPITYISLDVTNGKPHGTSADTNWLLGDGPGYPDFNPGSIQYNWLESQLADAQAHSRFTFVQFHHVPYSTGPHGFPAGSGAGFDNQSGVPVRALTPLFAQYGVDGVFSGHDETYQHSLASGVHFFDVGMGGDGLRGPSSGTDSLNPTIQTNPFQVFTAHLNAPEVWNGAQLVSGGKHYGHMEVNVTFDALAQTWEAKLEPVYIFPLMDLSGNITGWERRVYNDVTILTASEPAPPTVTLSSGVGSVAEDGGSTTLTATLSAPAPEDVFVYLQTNGTAVNNTDYQITSSAAPIAIDGDFSDWHNNPAILFGADPFNDTHDTDTNGAGNTPAYVNHPDVDLRAFGVTHDDENLYFYFRSEGQIGRTQVANPALSKAAGRYYVIVTMDVDQNDGTGYDLHLGGYYPTTPGYDMNSEIEFYSGTFNTGHYLNHGATFLGSGVNPEPNSLNLAFAQQSNGGYNPALASQDIQGPFTPGFVNVIPGSYDFYTQWVYKNNDPANGGNDSITFVKDKGPVVTGIIEQRVSADGHELEMIVPYKGFLVDELGNPIVDIGKILDLSFSLEASGELAPGNDWASDTADPLDGYALTAPSALPVNFIRIPKGQLSASVDLTAMNNLIVSPDRVGIVAIDSVTGAVEDGVQEVTVSLVNDDAPQIQTTPGTLSYTVGSPAIVIDAGLTSAVAAGSTYTEATVSVGAGYVAGDDILEFVNQAGITGYFDSTSGVLTFTGTADSSAYQSILRSVTYKNVGGSPANLERTVTFTVSSGSLSDSDTRLIQLMNAGQPVLVGIDFGSGGSLPTNWNSYSGSSNTTFPDLIGEDGNNSGISAEITRDSVPGGAVNFTPQASTLPQHTQSLAGIDRIYQDQFGNIQLSWGNLTPGASYEIYVFGGNEIAGNPRVTISGGAADIVFGQAHLANQLFVNDQVGDSNRTLSSYAKLMTANSSGQILVRVDSVLQSFFGTAGMAIRAAVTPPGITVTPISSSTTEAGGTATFSVSLDTQPTADVTIGLSSDDLTEGTIDKSSLTFTSVNWNTPQIVTVTGADDSVSDGNIVYHIVTAPANSSDLAYDGLNAGDVTVSNVDNDVQSLVVSPTALPVTEGGTNTFGVKLAFQPASNVTVNLAFSSGDGDLLVSGTTSLTFTPSNWNTAQNFTLAAAEDADTTNGTATFNVTSTGLTTVDVTATEADNDTQSLVVSPVALPVTEGGTNTFGVKLAFQPASNVTVNLTFSSGDGDLAVSGTTSLTFTPSNWNTAQNFTLGAAEDADTTNGTATFNVTSTGLTTVDVTATEADNDVQSLVVSPTALSVTEGGTNTFGVKLAFQPASNVTVNLAFGSGDGDLSVSGTTSLTFTPLNWNTVQNFTLAAAEDADTANGTATFNVTSTGLTTVDVTATEADNDVQSMVVTPTALSVTEGGTNTFGVKLAFQPASNVTVNLAFSSGDGDLSVSGTTSLTFTPLNWNTVQNFTLAAAEDADTANGTATFNVTSTGLTTVDVTATEADNDTQSLVVTPTALPVTEGGTNTFGVKLAFQPASDVTVNLAFGSGDGDLSVSGTTSLTFTPSNWNTAQNFTLAASEDSDTANGTATFNVTSTGLTTVDVAATEADNDTAAVTIENVSAIEGSGLLFTVTLDYAVAGGFDVTVNFTDGTASGGTDYDATSVILQFAGNAGETHQFTVNTTAETTVEANETFSVSLNSSNPLVDDADTATGTITNDDSAIVTLTSQSKVEGTGASPTIFVFTVNLSAPVDIPVSMTANTVNGSATAPSDYAAVTGATVSFPANSTTAQSVNVSVVADSGEELDEAFDLVLSELFAPSRAVTFELAAATLAATANVLNDDTNSGGPVRILDDGDAGYSSTGTWVQLNRNGYDDDFRFASPGGTNETSQWQFDDLVTGQYRISVSYRAWSNRATNAPYTVHDGATPLALVRVNQKLEASHRFESGTGYHDLGVFNIATGQLRVLLTDMANGIVSADSVRIERIGDLIAGPEISVSVDGVAINDNTGVLNFGDVQQGAVYTRTITVHNTGTTDLTISSLSLPAGFSLVSSPPAISVAPGTSTTFDVQIDTSLRGPLSGEFSMTVNDPDETPFNFLMQGNVLPSVQIIDNGGPGYSRIGDWSSINRNGFESDFDMAASGTGSSVARFTFDVTAGASYRISAAWRAYANRATDTPFTVRDGGTDLATVIVNQQLAPSADHVEGPSPSDLFQDLGTFTVSGTQLTIELTNNANGYVIADAIRIERL
jgi:hypothetical protein